MIVGTLEMIRDDANFNMLWTTTTSKELGIEEPQLPRRRKVPRRLESGNAEPHKCRISFIITVCSCFTLPSTVISLHVIIISPVNILQVSRNAWILQSFRYRLFSRPYIANRMTSSSKYGGDIAVWAT